MNSERFVKDEPESEKFCTFCKQPIINHTADCSYARILNGVQEFSAAYDRFLQSKKEIASLHEKLEADKYLNEKFAQLLTKIDKIFSLINKLDQEKRYELASEFDAKIDKLQIKFEYLLNITSDFTEKYFFDESVKPELFKYFYTYIGGLEDEANNIINSLKANE